ncbi:MAG: choice-of-anchor A family protein, partial [Ruminococcus sp.]|nr:choice-of-anchor A family protein [Ruminococcus sp.]
MTEIIEALKNTDKPKKRFLSMFIAVFMVFTCLGDSMSVLAGVARERDGIEDVTGNAQKNAELLDVPDADEKYLGMAGDFTIFVKEKFSIPEQAADIEGRLAAGGGVENNKPVPETYTIGNKYTGTGATVIVGAGTIDRLDVSSSEGAERRIFVVSSDTDITEETMLDPANVYISDDIIDYDAEFSKLSALSNEISEYEATGALEVNDYMAKFTGEAEDINIFHITQEEWEKLTALNYIEIHIPGDVFESYVIFNVEGKEVMMPHYSVAFFDDVHDEPVLVEQDTNDTPNAQLCGHILYNAYEAEDVKYTGSVQGSLLAVNANVSGENNGHVSGSTIARSAEGFGIQAGSITFNPPRKLIEKPGSEIFIGKTESKADTYLAGAVLEITEATGELDLSVAVSDAEDFKAEKTKISFVSDGKPINIKGLPDGEYELREVSSPDGYTVNKETVSFKIENGKTSENIIVITDTVSVVSVSKKAVTGDDEVPGATLILTLKKSYKSSDADLSEFAAGAVSAGKDKNQITWVSSDKPTEFSGLPDGLYLLEESVAPDGYTITDSFEFEIKDGIVSRTDLSVPGITDPDINSADNTITVKDALSKVTISKQEVSGAELPGAELTLTITENKSLLGVKSASDITVKAGSITWISGKTPTVLEGIPDGTYTLTENRAPLGFEVAESITFTVENGEVTGFADGTVVMVDYEKPEPSKIIISKQDISGVTEVPGARLTITAEDKDADLSVAVSEAEIKSEKNKVSWISGETPVIITNLPDGKYLLEESIAPDGYTVTDSIEFIISDGMISGTENNLVVMKDAPSEISISKSEINKSGEIPGAHLTVQLKEATKNKDADLLKVVVSGGASDVRPGKTAISFVSGTELAVITQLPDGVYELKETISPDGYTVSEETISFEIREGVLVSDNGSDRVVMEDAPSEITISKTDIAMKEEIPGAKLILTLMKANKTQGADLKAMASDKISLADESGKKITWTSGTEPMVLKGLPDGDYVLEESVAPDGYTITGKMKFTIIDGEIMGAASVAPRPEDGRIDSENNRVIMIDKLSEVPISKVNVAGKEIPGAKLTLTIAESKDLSRIKSDTNLTIDKNSVSWISEEKPTIIKGLPDGTYTLEETQAPDGYEVTESVTFTIENGVPSPEKIVMVDEYTKVTVSKTDVAGREVPGAHITLTETSGKKDLSKVQSASDIVIDDNKISWVSGKAPVVLEGLPDGEYTLEETVAPDRYTVTDSVSFRIVNGEVQSVESTVPGLNDSKVDSASNTVIMVDELSKVNIRKTNVAGKEIDGAHLTLTLVSADEKDATLLKASVSGGGTNFIQKSNSIEFVSGITETVIEGIPDGKYILTETQAPEGYEIAESISFTVENGKVKESDDDTLTMVDEIIVTTTVVTTTVPETTTTVTTTTVPETTTTVTTTTVPETTTTVTTTTVPETTTTVTTTTVPETTTTVTTTTV